MKSKRQIENFVTQKPKSKFIQQYIAYYYFDKCTDEASQKQYVFYPHFKNALSIYKNSIVKYDKNQSWTLPDESIKYFYAYEGIRKKPRKVFQQGPFDKVGIVFQALGINHFFNKPFADFSIPVFDHFSPSMDVQLDRIYKTDIIAEKVELLDAYFETQYQGFKENRLLQAVHLLLNSTTKYSVNDIAKRLSMSRKTLLRLFKKHLSCSVKDYINVVQFRKALYQYQLATDKPLLTHLAYDNGYYDQSEFINHFKKITGYNPKRIFQNIQLLGNEDTFWTLPSLVRKL